MIKYKFDNAYKTIGEVAKELNLVNSKTGKLNTHTVRFWEREFKLVKPKIFSGKRRYYDKSNVEILKKIKFLLKDKGMTINGVKKLLNSNDSNQLDESANKSIKAINLRNKIHNILKIIKKLKRLKKYG